MINLLQKYHFQYFFKTIYFQINKIQIITHKNNEQKYLVILNYLHFSLTESVKSFAVNEYKKSDVT